MASLGLRSTSVVAWAARRYQPALKAVLDNGAVVVTFGGAVTVVAGAVVGTLVGAPVVAGAVVVGVAVVVMVVGAEMVVVGTSLPRMLTRVLGSSASAGHVAEVPVHSSWESQMACWGRQTTTALASTSSGIGVAPNC